MALRFHNARLLEAHDETSLLRALRLGVPEAVASSYVRAGQFLEVRLPGQTAGAYFAIASGPDGKEVELLVKRGEGLPDALAALPTGSAVELTGALGPGFPMESTRGRDLLLFATGSGIAPIRAAWQQVMRERQAWGELHLYFGVRDEFPYEDELHRLEAAGAHVHLVTSRRAARHGRYVQERFREQLPRLDNAEALLCGLEGMIAGVREALQQAGLSAEKIHLNT